jgi:hypothetical protein
MVKIKFDFSYPLTEGILKQEFNEKYFSNKLSLVEDIFYKNEKKIFKLINEFTGMEFKTNLIEIWLVGGKCPSISNPPLLNINRKESLILFDLLTILVHRLFYFNDFYDFFLGEKGIDETKLEAMVYLVSQKVMEKILSIKEFRNTIKELKSDMFNKFIWDEVDLLKKKISFQKPLIDLNIEKII